MFLYLLQFKNLPSYFKIGITKNVTSRVSTLKNTWGELDYDNSFVVTSPKERSITLLERELHLIFPDDDNFIMEHKGKDGYSEFRSLSHFDECLDIIKVQKHSSFNFSVNGVSEYLVTKESSSSHPIDTCNFDIQLTKRKSNLDSIGLLKDTPSRKNYVTDKRVNVQKLTKVVKYIDSLIDRCYDVTSIGNNVYKLRFEVDTLKDAVYIEDNQTGTFGIISCTRYESRYISSLVVKIPKDSNICFNGGYQYTLYPDIKKRIKKLTKRLDGFNKLEDENVLSLYKDLLSHCNNIHISSECSESMTFELSFKDGIKFDSTSSIRSVCNNNSNQVIGITYVIMNEDKLLLECGVRFLKDISNQNFLYDSEDNSRKITRQFIDEYNQIKTNYFYKICPF